MRISRREIMLEVSKAIGKRGTCLRAKVGCVIEKGGRILSTGYNGSSPGDPHCEDVGCEMVDGHCIRTVHAEANAICFAAKHGISVEGATLYVTGREVCHRCMKLAKAAGITEIIAEEG
jgi:dCMP deaminase